MTIFLRLLRKDDKSISLLKIAHAVRVGIAKPQVFEVDPEAFQQIPRTPFAYWISQRVRDLFTTLPIGETSERTFSKGLCTTSDDRFVRTYWEIQQAKYGRSLKWSCYANGGSYSPFYWDYPAVVLTQNDFEQLRAYLVQKFPYLKGSASWLIHDENDYQNAVVAWPLRTHVFSPQALPQGFVFSARTYAALVPEDRLFVTVGFLSSKAVDFLLKTTLGREGHPEFVNGALQSLPFPAGADSNERLGKLARQAWSLKRTLDTVTETSHAFLLPISLCTRLGDYDPLGIEEKLVGIQAEIDEIACNLYGFDEKDRAEVLGKSEEGAGKTKNVDKGDEGGAEEEVKVKPMDTKARLLSWCAGVTFGRFDWRLATGEREPPPEPEPFDPLPAKSPGMLPDAVEPFHHHAGILVDDPGQPHDLPRLIESVLERVATPMPSEVRRWLQRDFFKEHLKQYSKSRRKAPIYWPLATASGSYTLWVYYPTLTAQTLYTAVNDFIEPKLKSISQTAEFLQGKTDRSKAEEQELEQLQDFELELTDLRDTLLQVAKDYVPNHDDGVQITAAPLWPLFRHKPWQKVLKETWKKLEKGDYDWAHLAMNYWPERVREKCRTDKSLAIAHGLEELYEAPPEQTKKKRGREKA